VIFRIGINVCCWNLKFDVLLGGEKRMLFLWREDYHMKQ
jgi:hypothetical protein